MKNFMNLFLSALLVVGAFPTQAQVVEGKYSREISSTPNWIKDGNAEAYSSGWTGYNDSAAAPVDGTGGTVTGVTMAVTTTTPLEGKKSFVLTKDASNRQGIGFAIPINIDLAFRNSAQTLSFHWDNTSGTFVPGTDIKIYLYDITNARLVPLPRNTLRTDTNGVYSEIFQATGSGSYRLLVHIASTSSSAYNFRMDSIRTVTGGVFGGTMPNTFTAKISTTGVVSDETGGDFLNGNCSKPMTGQFTCTFNSGFFTTTPNIVAQITNDNHAIANVSSPSSSGFTGWTSADGNPGALTDFNYSIVVTKVGADFIQPAITPSIEGFINEFGAAVSTSGVVSNENQDFISSFCAITDTSLFTCTFVTDKFPVAPNCTVSVVDPSLDGAWQAKVNATVTTTSLVVRTGTTDSTNNFVKAVRAFYVRCSRGEGDYRPQANTPILNGSITSSAAVNQFKMESATVGSTGTVVEVGGSDWITGNCTNANPRVCTITGFSAAPICLPVYNGGASAYGANISAATSSSISVYTYQTEDATPTAQSVNLVCFGLR